MRLFLPKVKFPPPNKQILSTLRLFCVKAKPEVFAIVRQAPIRILTIKEIKSLTVKVHHKVLKMS
jgi:hypothetical protein